MPGLVDAHVHVTAVAANLSAMAEWSPYYVAARAGEVLRGMLSRGFTTVRDVGGADFGIAEAVDEGYLDGPRVIFGGKALSQTGGHADIRSRGRIVKDPCELSPGARRRVRRRGRGPPRGSPAAAPWSLPPETDVERRRCLADRSD